MGAVSFTDEVADLFEQARHSVEAGHQLAQLMKGYEGMYVLLWVHTADGNLQTLEGGRFVTVEGGDVFLFGQVIDIGEGELCAGYDPYFLLSFPGQPVTKVHIQGIQHGYRGDLTALLQFVHATVKEAFTGDEQVETALEKSAFTRF